MNPLLVDSSSRREDLQRVRLDLAAVKAGKHLQRQQGRVYCARVQVSGPQPMNK